MVSLSGDVTTRTEGRLLEELSQRVDGVIRVESNLVYELGDAIQPVDRGRAI